MQGEDDLKPVGVIGGLGPAATVSFLDAVVKLTVAERDQDHVDLLVSQHSSTPDRTDFILGRSVADPTSAMVRQAQLLDRAGVEFLVLPCNTAHHFLEQVATAVPHLEVVSIVDETAAAALRRTPDLKTVGVLATEGTLSAQVYQQAFALHGVEVSRPTPAEQETINAVIYDQVKAGKPVDLLALQRVIDSLEARGAQLVVLGCTELSVAAMEHGLLADPLLVDSLDSLARVTIQKAGKQVRDAK